MLPPAGAFLGVVFLGLMDSLRDDRVGRVFVAPAVEVEAVDEAIDAFAARRGGIVVVARSFFLLER